jgi:glycosyltransferase involved in cell wall biosynthesis
MPKNLLIISQDAVGTRMAGPGIRYWELARALAAHIDITLLAPRPIDLHVPGVRGASYTWGDAASLAPYLAQADAILANGYLLQAHPELAEVPVPLLLDLYDPTLLENLEARRAEPLAERSAQTASDVALLGRQLAAGAGFLCATERQRDLYLGALMAAGRVTPARTEGDPLLRDLIAVLPFGLPAEAPAKTGPALRGVVAGIGLHDPLILWSGGLWDWMDPQTLVQAMPAVLEQHPTARLVFLAGRHPTLGLFPRAAAEAMALAEQQGLLGRNIFFYEQWVPYHERANFLLEATIVVSLHRQHLETAYAALRSRFLDHLWVGVPSLVSAGDQAAALVQAEGIGLVVPPQDSAAVAGALQRLLADESLRVAQAARARELAPQYAWPGLIEPVIRFVERATVQEIAPFMTEKATSSPTKSTNGASTVPPSAPAADQHSPTNAAQIEQERLLHMTRNSAVAALEETWRVSERPLPGGRLARLRQLFVDHLVRPFVQPLIEQQQAQNAAVLRAAYAINELNDYQRILIERSYNMLRDAQNVQRQHFERLNEFTGQLEHLAFRVGNIEQGMEVGSQQQLALIHQLAQQIRDFSLQLEGLEQTDAQLFAHMAGVPAAPPRSYEEEA